MAMNARLLRPTQNTHPEAADWANRVRTNGGSVSGSTLTAVSRFCRAIDASGIRDRFYRLNLFAGTGLSACLVPLYRGPSASGTQYGSTTETNVGPFVSGDYTETGATGGLDANGNGNKYLNTGYAPLASGSPILANGHVTYWAMKLPTARQSIIGTRKDSAPAGYATSQMDNLGKTWAGWGTGTAINGAGAASAPLFGSVTRRSDSRVYLAIDGSAVSDAAAADPPNAHSTNFGVFAVIFDNGSFGASPIRFGGYSVGAELSASHVSSLYTAWNTLQVALGRK